MVINESELEFVFNEGVNAIKFDDTEFYRKSFNRLPGAKGVDIIAHSNNEIQLIEVKNCTGHEPENRWRINVNNSKLTNAPRELDVENRNSLDIEVAQKVAMTISCLFGSWTNSEINDTAAILANMGKSMNQKSLLSDRKSLVVLLILEGDFGGEGEPKSRSKKMIMGRIKSSIADKLKWLKCRVEVVDSNTNRNHLFSIQ